MYKKIIPFLIIVATSVLVLIGCSERAATLTVAFETNGGTAVEEKTGTVNAFPITTKTGYCLEGWYIDGSFNTRVKFPFTATQNTTLYARWTDLNQGSAEIEYKATETGEGFIAYAYRLESYAVCIPDAHMNLPVVGVSVGFLKYKAYLNELYIGKNVTEMNDELCRCPSLKRIEITGNNPKYSIMDDALVDNQENKIVAYPRGLQKTEFTFNMDIDKNALKYNSVIEKIILGKNATLPGGAFSDMSSLFSIEVSEDNPDYKADGGILYSRDGLTLYRFPENRRTDYFTIPDTVITVEEEAFCNALVGEIRFGKNLKNYYDASYTPELKRFAVSGNEVYSDKDGVLYSADGKTLFRYPCGADDGEYSVPEGTERIDAFGFVQAKNLVSVYLPKSLKEIGNQAFSACYLLQEVTFAEGSEIEVINEGAFSGCNSLKKMIMTARVPPVTGETLFSSVKNTKEFTIVIPDNTDKIYARYWAFCYMYLTPTGKSLEVFAIDFQSNGGSNFDAFVGTILMDEPIPTYENRIFYGWYDNPDVTGERVSFPFIPTEDVTLYAFWGYDEENDNTCN